MIGSREFDGFVSRIALENSRLRKLASLEDRLEVLDTYSSAEDELAHDWSGAVARLLEWVATGPFSFASLDESFLDRLSLAWLDDVKQFKAYLAWRASHTADGFWSTNVERARDYWKGCSEVHNWLSSPGNKLEAHEFKVPRHYIQSHYQKDGVVNSVNPRVQTLIHRKARRLWQAKPSSGNLENWLQAERYVKSFYSNIVPAIDGQNKECIVAVLEAFQIGCESDRQSIMVDGFEAALAIRFLNPEIVDKFVGLTGRPIF